MVPDWTRACSCSSADRSSPRRHGQVCPSLRGRRPFGEAKAQPSTVAQPNGLCGCPGQARHNEPAAQSTTQVHTELSCNELLARYPVGDRTTRRAQLICPTSADFGDRNAPRELLNPENPLRAKAEFIRRFKILRSTTSAREKFHFRFTETCG